jgi:hypothetical protein
VNRNDLIDKIIRLSPSLPGARQLDAAHLALLDTEVLRKQADRLDRVADARTKVKASPQRDAELDRLRNERAVLVGKMRAKLQQAKITKNAPAAQETAIAVMKSAITAANLAYETAQNVTTKVFEIAQGRFRQTPSNEIWQAAAKGPSVIPQYSNRDVFVFKAKGRTLRQKRRADQLRRQLFSTAVVEKVPRAASQAGMTKIDLPTYIAHETSVPQADVNAVLKTLDGVMEDDMLKVLLAKTGRRPSPSMKMTAKKSRRVKGRGPTIFKRPR